MVQRWFIHYFEPGSRVFPNGFGTRIAESARALKTASGKPFFDHILTYRQADLDPSFIKERAVHFKHSKGAGYWCWKPYIIKMTLAKMAVGDELLYCDTGIQLTPDFMSLFVRLRAQDVVPFQNSRRRTDNQWGKMDVAVKLKAVTHMSSIQRTAGIVLFRKSLKSVKLVEQWNKAAGDFNLINDTPSRTPNHSTFKQHKHDQTIFSLLTKVHGYKVYPFPSFLQTIRYYPDNTSSITVIAKDGTVKRTLV